MVVSLPAWVLGPEFDPLQRQFVLCWAISPPSGFLFFLKFYVIAISKVYMVLLEDGQAQPGCLISNTNFPWLWITGNTCPFLWTWGIPSSFMSVAKSWLIGPWVILDLNENHSLITSLELTWGKFLPLSETFCTYPFKGNNIITKELLLGLCNVKSEN